MLFEEWACMANVVIAYEWSISQKVLFESFGYGPKSYVLYSMGGPRVVPYKGCGPSYDEDWLDDFRTECCGVDEQKIKI